MPRRDFDSPCRGCADADRAISDGAAFAPVTRSRKPPAPTPETTASGEIAATGDRARPSGSVVTRCRHE